MNVRDGWASACRGVRGAITIDGEGPDAVDQAVAELLDELARRTTFSSRTWRR